MLAIVDHAAKRDYARAVTPIALHRWRSRSDFGADMYGLALVTPKKFADENPGTVRGVVKALNAGTRDTIASPQQALDILTARDSMMRPDIEKVRLDIALGLVDTP